VDIDASETRFFKKTGFLGGGKKTGFLGRGKNRVSWGGKNPGFLIWEDKDY